MCGMRRLYDREGNFRTNVPTLLYTEARCRECGFGARVMYDELISEAIKNGGTVAK